jgi:hypothetical protein
MNIIEVFPGYAFAAPTRVNIPARLTGRFLINVKGGGRLAG